MIPTALQQKPLQISYFRVQRNMTASNLCLVFLEMHFIFQILYFEYFVG